MKIVQLNGAPVQIQLEIDRSAVITTVLPDVGSAVSDWSQICALFFNRLKT